MKLYGKEKPLGRINAFIQSGRFPHGILFTGDSGVGKGVLARYTARLLLCDEYGRNGAEPCGRCNSCRKAEDGCHPDINDALSAMPDGKYKIQGMRELISGGSIRPNDGDIRIYIFRSLDTMSPACQNTLLKFIEEPSEFNRFIFTAGSLSGILQTIVSRLTEIQVSAASVDECTEALISEGMVRNDAEKAALISGGNIGKALESTGEAELRGKVSALIKAITEKNEYSLAAAFSTFTKRDELASAIPLLTLSIRDAIAVKNGLSAEMSGMGESASELAKSLPSKRLLRLADYLGELSAALLFNPNIALTVSLAAARIAEITTG